MVAFSLEPEEMALLVSECRTAYQALGEITYDRQPQEEKSLVFRRSIYVTKDVVKGERFTEENTRIIRPGLGLAPKYIGVIQGKHAVRDIERGTPLSWDIIA